MARAFESIRANPDRGDGKPFVQAEWKNEFQQLQTKEVSGVVPPGLLVALGQILDNIKQQCEDEAF